MAIYGRDKETVKELLNNILTIDLSIKNHSGQSAFDAALRYHERENKFKEECKEIVEMIERAQKNKIL